jgi:hypothetical protein
MRIFSFYFEREDFPQMRRFIQERKSGNIIETKHSAAQEEPDSVSSVK